jgi:hypothetical protein
MQNDTIRGDLLLEAISLITGDRNVTYGSPTQNFQDIADMLTIALRHKLVEGASIDPGEVAKFMIIVKIARMTAQPKKDNWLDIAGYAGCGYEADKATNKI